MVITCVRGVQALGAALLLTVLSLAAPVAAVPSRGPEVSAAPDWVLFQRSGEQRVEVALIRSDATGVHNPVADVGGGGDQSNPDWSPDGRRVVFAMSDGKRDDLWVAGIDGRHARRVLDCAGPCRWLDDPDWSPDGRHVVYSRTIRGRGGDGVSTLETVDVRTGRVRVLLGPWRRQFTAGARYSPGGERMVFERVHKVDAGLEADIDGVTLTVVRLGGTGRPLRALTDSRLYAATSDWSPNGRLIVYSALPTPDSSAPDLFLVGPRGGTPVRVTSLGDDGGYANEPAWRPDSRGLLFSGRVDGSAGLPLLLEVQSDGSGLGSAFGEDLVYGRHPRVQPAP
jgi:Tol biopolymer transport system component